MLSSALCVVRCAQHGVRLVAGALLSSSVPCWWSRGEDVLLCSCAHTIHHTTPHHNNNCWQLQLPASGVLQPRNHWKDPVLCSVFCYPLELELVLVPTAPLSSIMMTYFRYTHYHRWVKAVPVCCAGLGRGPCRVCLTVWMRQQWARRSRRRMWCRPSLFSRRKKGAKLNKEIILFIKK